MKQIQIIHHNEDVASNHAAILNDYEFDLEYRFPYNFSVYNEDEIADYYIVHRKSYVVRSLFKKLNYKCILVDYINDFVPEIINWHVVQLTDKLEKS